MIKIIKSNMPHSDDQIRKMQESIINLAKKKGIVK